MKRIAGEHDEDYFVSMTDMMVGILLIFIIMLMYFVLQFHVRTEQREEAIRELTEAQKTRAEILREVKRLVEARSATLRVEIDEASGVLRLPNEVLFERGQFELTQEGRSNIRVLADALDEVLPCYAWRPRELDLVTCPKKLHRIEALFVEGHTDSDALNGVGPVSDNWDLSALRATTAFRAVTQAKPRLLKLKTGENGSPVFSVSGYGPDRPADEGVSVDAKRKNRRIELRIIMQTPRIEELNVLQQGLRGGAQ